MKKIVKHVLFWIVLWFSLTILFPKIFVSTVTYTATPTVLAKEETPKKKPTLVPELVPVCACESTGRWNGTPTQFDSKGNVYHGKINNNDIGMCQINMEARNGHLARTKKLGLDVYTEAGNIEYANYLYKLNGLKDWSWSKHCWKDHIPL